MFPTANSLFFLNAATTDVAVQAVMCLPPQSSTDDLLAHPQCCRHPDGAVDNEPASDDKPCESGYDQ